MKKRSIYQNRSQELYTLFESADNTSKIMCIPMDYAKKHHVAMFCNGYGDIIRKPFPVKNSPAGLDYLVDQVKRSCAHRGVQLQHVFFGGEDVSSYSENFVHSLRSMGWLVASVNAHEAKKQRENLQASTDRLDLMGIASMLLSRRANTNPAQSGIYRNLRTIVRHRKKLVKMKTEVKNRIHTVVDHLFSGFLDETRSGIRPFSKSSLYLMSGRFSARQINRRKLAPLAKALRRFGTNKPDKAAVKLKGYAAKAFSAPEPHLHTLQLSLSCHVKHYSCLDECIQQLEKEIAFVLSQTQGAFLTSIKGIGIVLAAGICSEIGDPFIQGSAANLVSYAGVVPRVKQSGGPESEPRVGSVSKRNNHILKDYLVQASNHIGRHGPEDLKQDFKRRQCQAQNAEFGMARRLMRITMGMMKTWQIYMPGNLRTDQVDKKDRARYYLSIWPYITEKWSKLAPLEKVFAKDQPLGQWRDVVQQLYEIKLGF
jgi:transposase